MTQIFNNNLHDELSVRFLQQEIRGLHVACVDPHCAVQVTFLSHHQST